MTQAKSTYAAFVLIGLLACTQNQAKPDAVESAAAPSSMPAATGAPRAARTASATGTVAETMDAASYTYIRIATSSGDRWAAVPQTKLAVGDPVTIVDAMVMTNFASPTLKRTFNEILFGTLAGQAAAAPAAPTAAPPSAVSNAPVEKAAGATGRTIAQVFANKSTLKDNSVTVRGRVTKYNAGILGRNWLHIVDGTGTKATGDDDLTVTTLGTANVGDVVVVSGPVHLNKDFGAGYAYGVIIEDATIAK